MAAGCRRDHTILPHRDCGTRGLRGHTGGMTAGGGGDTTAAWNLSTKPGQVGRAAPERLCSTGLPQEISSLRPSILPASVTTVSPWDCSSPVSQQRAVMVESRAVPHSGMWKSTAGQTGSTFLLSCCKRWPGTSAPWTWQGTACQGCVHPTTPASTL